MAAVCYTLGLSRYSTALATIKSLDSPVILAIGYVLDFVVSPVKFPFIEMVYYVGQPYKPGADFPKSGLKRCGKRRHHFLDCGCFIIPKA